MNMRDGSTRGLLVAILLLSLPALAYEGSSTVNFNVTGTIEAPSCEVAVEPSNSIDLGTVSSQTFSGHAGASGASVPVKLVFSSCSADASAVTIAFSGTSFDSTHASIYKNFQTGSNGASGVGLQLQSMADQQPLGPGDQYLYTFGDDADIHTFNMVARMFSPYGQVRSGMVGLPPRSMWLTNNVSTGMGMKKLILLLILALCPVYSWAACTGTNYGDVSMTNLPEKILVNAGSYTAGTVLYDSGKITRSQTELLNCEGSTYAVFAWSANNAGALIGDNIYATSVQGIGIRVKVWLNISGEYGDDTDDFSPDSQVHYIGDVNYYLGKPTGLFDSFASTHYTPAYQLQLVATGGAIASKSQLSFSDPVATVSAKDKKGTIAISQLHISGTTSIQLIPMGCIVGSNNLSFSMGSINASEFNTATKVGSARQSLSLSCEPGTNVSMRVAAASASGDNPDNTVMALTAEQNAATGVGVQLNLNGKALPLNTDISLYTSSRATVTNSGADASYSYFTNPDSPGGAAAMQTLALSTNYYRTGSAVTAGTANATGVITFTYN